jgi:hypothetical protein
LIPNAVSSLLNVRDAWKILTLDDHHYVATWDRVLIQVWRGEATPLAIFELGPLAETFLREEREPISSLAIIEASATPPSEVARKELSRFYREFAPRMMAAIVVAEGGGFRAAFVRGVGITLSTLAPRSLPFTFASNVKDAATVLAPHLSKEAGGAAGLLSALADLRELPTRRPDSQGLSSR